MKTHTSSFVTLYCERCIACASSLNYPTAREAQEAAIQEALRRGFRYVPHIGWLCSDYCAGEDIAKGFSPCPSA